MKKLLVFSDSHGNVANMADTVRLEQPDGILHLGDLVRDAQRLGEQYTKEALDALEAFPGDTTFLREFALSLVERES